MAQSSTNLFGSLKTNIILTLNNNTIMRKNPKDFSGNGKNKVFEMHSTLNELKNEQEVEKFVEQWKEDFLKTVKDDFIKHKVDEICETLMYFLLANDESGTLSGPDHLFNFNRARKDNILWFAFYK